ncbi:hypothetical protein GGX14DRAFT_116601 [Mycena pura]|uniref:DUF6534 domain-containing protein n=1 Tax=Mycena pura TaxID=153505 RepID=A0AAD6VEI8_9AGAR|nr:hypothetical protein GGX14DRAFT_116601 [Mycena pura]
MSGSLPSTLGALLLGGLFASVLGGMVNLQGMLYYRSYKKDPSSIKLLVFAVWLLDNLHTGFIWGALWIALINRNGDTDTDPIPWCIALTLIITAVVTFLVQCFFAHRVYLISRRNLFMTVPVLALTLLRLVASCISTWKMLHNLSYHLFRVHALWVFTLGLAVSSVVDILLTSLLVYLFRTNRTETGHLNQTIDTLILYGVEAGSITWCIPTFVQENMALNEFLALAHLFPWFFGSLCHTISFFWASMLSSENCMPTHCWQPSILAKAFVMARDFLARGPQSFILSAVPNIWLIQLSTLV